ncbi:MAG: 1-acyl-sn-glycerol-3-phosphate acyltransferase [Magnetococcales bacterium]|nr:1-acyl-sn-glycerol-3-phosphate acyltransferase [Magnetococcales bacterium]
MVQLRSIVFFVLFMVTVIVYSLAILCAWPVAGLAVRRRLAAAWGTASAWLLARICGLRHRVIGLENLPPPPYVLLSKHQSAWETVVFHAIFPDVVWVLKKSLLYIPFFGWALRASGQIFIDRDQGTQAMKKLHRESRRNFDRGTSLIIFPEGTRVAPGEVGDYKPGGVGIAMAAGLPIVPVAHNAGLYWARRSLLKRPGEVQVRIGRPIPTVGLSRTERKELLNRVREAIEGMMRELSAR